MSSEIKKEIQLEIAHVLFIDIVGYSKLSINDQRAAIDELTQAVRASEQVQNAEAAARLIKIPTGDGMALVFYKSPEEPVECALEISRALKDHRQLRMGVHSGPVSGVIDVNGQANLAGAGLNVAQRVMDCGDAGHILLSKRVADDLGEYKHWRPLLHDLGECEVKHRMRVSIVNLHADEVGNPQPPKKFQALKKRRARMRLAATTVALLVLVVTFVVVSKKSARSTSTIPEKSIAVLPMINSSADPANEYFSDGMSEEFISSLGRLPDLKVVGRTSSFQFKGKSDDSKTIGEKLGVSYLLEGSVQRSADRVRIWVRLIKSGDGANVWSETYDRDLQDIFAVQSEIAGSVAKELKIALLGNNQTTIGTAPSNENLDAYTAFLQGNFYAARHTAEDFRKAIGYYEKAVQLDPRYALAYANLSNIASNLVYNFANPTTKEGQEIVVRAREAADTALRLDPDLSEAHLAKGTFLRIIDLNYAAAEGECRRALELAPKNAGALLNLALLKGFAGDFKEALKLTEQELALDPLRSGGHMNYATYLAALGRFDEAEATLQSIARRSSGSQTYMALTRVEIERGRPGPALDAAKKEPDPFFRTYALAIAYFASGNQTQADAQLKKLIDEDTDDGGVQIASIYALRKEPDKVFEWLERAWLNHDPGVSEIMLDPFLRTCKDDPRFIAFAQKIGVMPKAATHL